MKKSEPVDEPFPEHFPGSPENVSRGAAFAPHPDSAEGLARELPVPLEVLSVEPGRISLRAGDEATIDRFAAHLEEGIAELVAGRLP